MSRQIARPALVPLAMAVGVPMSLVRISPLIAVLSLLVSLLLVGLALVMGAERRRSADMATAWRTEIGQAYGFPAVDSDQEIVR